MASSSEEQPLKKKRGRPRKHPLPLVENTPSGGSVVKWEEELIEIYNAKIPEGNRLLETVKIICRAVREAELRGYNKCAAEVFTCRFDAASVGEAINNGRAELAGEGEK